MLKRIIVVLAIGFVGVLVWVAAGPNKTLVQAPRAMGASPAVLTATSNTGAAAGAPQAPVPNTTDAASPPAGATQGAVPTEVLAPIATATATLPPPVTDTTPVIRDPEAPRPMIVPVAGIPRSAMHDMFNEVRGNKRHEAIDILAPRGTPVIATDDGVVKKLFTSVPGGLTIYEFDPDQRFCYYYAHLDGYAAGLHEGQSLHRGDIIGYVGTTGNAPKDTPHLHFALIRLDPERRWWKGTYVNPYPLLALRPGS
jgi:murein DD-endopeptidase MepM/ murein hydrolase activator NlpD